MTADGDVASRAHPAWRVALGVAVLAYLAVVVRCAWLGDDAYITLRVVENLADGHGLRWNVADRVLVSTHPLWLLLLGGLRLLTGEVYFTTIFCSIALSIVAVAMVVRGAGSTPAAVAAVSVLLSSRAFVDYSTSGLENPLAHALIAVFAAIALRAAGTRAALFWLSVVGGFLMCTRYDLVLVVAPAIVATWWRLRSLRAALVVAFGLQPLFAWLAFATVYFGSPLPMPSHAKLLATGIPLSDMLVQGWSYVVATLVNDPVTIVFCAGGVLAGLMRRVSWPLSLGASMYVAYTVRIGGDFMLGRFFTVPLLLGVICGARVARRPWLSLVLTLGVLAGGLWSPRPPLLSRPSDQGQGTVAHGINDERSVYYPSLGLLSPTRSIPAAGAATQILRASHQPEPAVIIAAAVGVIGFAAGPGYHLVDTVICDPLICRLPAKDEKNWRVGHLFRRVPDGYLQSVFAGDNQIRSPALARYYRGLSQLIRGEIFARERLVTIWRFARGHYDHLLREYAEGEYRVPKPRQVSIADLRSTPDQTPWHDARCIGVYDGGVEIDLGTVSHAASFKISLHSQAHYVVEMRRGGVTVSTRRVFTNPGMRYGMGTNVVDVPQPARDAGFDRIFVRCDFAASIDHVAALGHIEF